MADVLQRLDSCIESVQRWSEWPEEGDIGCLIEVREEIVRLRKIAEERGQLIYDR